jgi:hypothetical protein
VGDDEAVEGVPGPVLRKRGFYDCWEAEAAEVDAEFGFELATNVGGMQQNAADLVKVLKPQ